MCAEGTRARGRGARGAGTSRHGERTRRGVDEGAEPLGRTGTWRGGVWGPPTTGCTGVRGRRGARDGSRGRVTGAGEGGAQGRRKGKGRGRERERGAHLGFQIRRSPSPKPRAPRGGRGGRGGCCAGELNEGKRPGEGGRMGEGQDARGARAKAGPGWAAPRVKILWHAQPQIGIQIVERD
jgi:hypothetical protein